MTSSQPSWRDCALREARLLREMHRRTIRRDLAAWCTEALRPEGLRPAAHHRLLLAELEAVARGENNRLMVLMPPGSAKSTYVSDLFPAWYLAQHPRSAVLAASHSSALAETFSRRVQRRVNDHGALLGYGLDREAVELWNTTRGGQYMAAGVGVGIAGFRGDLGIIDDPVKSREAADSQVQRDRVWEWWRWDFVPRLKPRSAVVLVMCMTGDTPVLMADGSEKALRDICLGDVVATYRDGKLSTSKITNWINHGSDVVFEIRMTSGTVVRANERHPFLAYVDGEPRWIRLKDLSPGIEIFRVNGENGKARPALGRAAKSRFQRAVTALRTTIRSDGQTAFGLLRTTLRLDAPLGSNTVTGSAPNSTIGCTLRRADCAPSASNLRGRMSALTGAGSSAWIIATLWAAFARCFATTAISRSGTSRPPQQQTPSRSTCDFTRDRIEEIRPAGIENVFDIEVAETENFIANGLVSHNTRWHEDDLGGRLEQDAASGGRPWRIVRLPMLAEADDPLGRTVGDPLWPEWFTDEMRAEARRDPRAWSAQYQQRPVPESGGYFQREWVRTVPAIPPVSQMRLYGASDYAVTDGGGDWTVHLVVGLTSDGRLYLVDLWRGQTTPDVWADRFCDMVIRWRPIGWAEETGQIRGAVGPFLAQRQMERRAFVAREAFPTRGDKSVRAQSIRGRMSLSGLYVAADAPFLAELLPELLAFPAGKHDDQADALGLVGQLLDRMERPREDVPDVPLPPDVIRVSDLRARQASTRI